MTEHGSWGEPYGYAFVTPRGRRVVMRRGRYGRVRFYDQKGRQVGPEQKNVAPAVAYAMHQGWKDEGPQIQWLGERSRRAEPRPNPSQRWRAGELRRGTEHEMEHTDDPRVAKQIALDHLAEDPRYYEKLERCMGRNPYRSQRQIREEEQRASSGQRAIDQDGTRAYREAKDAGASEREARQYADEMAGAGEHYEYNPRRRSRLRDEPSPRQRKRRPIPASTRTREAGRRLGGGTPYGYEMNEHDAGGYGFMPKEPASRDILKLRAASGGDMTRCPTCGRRPEAPYRRIVGGRIVEGCIDAIHTASLEGGVSESSSWHFRKEAVRQRREELKRLKAMGTGKRRGHARNVHGAGNYWVWAVQKGGTTPLLTEGPYGPHDLDGAKSFARIGATEGTHDRAVSRGRDPQASGFEIVRIYRAGSGERIG